MNSFVAVMTALGLTAVDRRADLVMAAAVEAFVAELPGARIPEPFPSAIEDLGADCYGCRERASKRLAAMVTAEGGCATRWLFWGRRHRDPEVRLRCNAILQNLTRCADCGGRGECRIYRPAGDEKEGPCTICKRWPWGHPECPGPCLLCGGEGFAWIKGAFD
jgi:hypothetical protein